MHKLFFSPHSPYARKVRIFARERGVQSAIKEIEVAPLQDDSALRPANPLGKVPALELESGETYFDSPLLIEVIDALGSGPSAIPQEPPGRFKMLWWQSLADGAIDALVTVRFQGAFYGAAASEALIYRQWQAVDGALAAAEARSASLLTDYGLDVISMASLLGYLDYRFADRDWRSAHPNLAQLYESWRVRPSYQETIPPG
jgi:glutathione S-transferase